MKPERGLKQFQEGWVNKDTLGENGLVVAKVHQALGGAVNIVVPCELIAGRHPNTNGEYWISHHPDGKTAYPDDFPVGYRAGFTSSQAVEVSINPSLSKLNREQRALAIVYAISRAAAISGKSGVEFKINLPVGKTISSEVMEFIAQLTGSQQSMAIDLLRAAINHSK